MDEGLKIIHETYVNLYTSEYLLLKIKDLFSIFSKALLGHLQLFFYSNFLYMSLVL